jgi:hypothetical protein
MIPTLMEFVIKTMYVQMIQKSLLDYDVDVQSQIHLTIEQVVLVKQIVVELLGLGQFNVMEHVQLNYQYWSKIIMMYVHLVRIVVD